MDVSICILTHNQPELLPRCVNSCVAEIQRAGLAGEIILVDNASRDGYPEKLRGIYPHVTILRNDRNSGFSAGNNQAIRQSKGRNILILNDDVLLCEYSLVLMICKLESDPKIGAIGPKLLNPDGSLQKNFTNQRATTLRSMLSNIFYASELFDKWWLTRRMLTQLKDDTRSGETDELAGACLLIKRKALDDVGLFDENFFYWWEDKDLCWRLRRASWILFYLAEAAVAHHKSSSTGKLENFERSIILYKSQMYFLKKYLSPLGYLINKLALTLALGLRAPVAALYRLLAHRGNFADAKNSALVSLRLALWLMRECE